MEIPMEKKGSKLYQKCMLCPRRCLVNRDRGEIGRCGQLSGLRVARTSLHMWEEPCLSGTKGSGTVFFTGCGLHCVYCQNAKLTNQNLGETIGEEHLAQLLLRLQDRGANNINLVTGAHFVPGIVKVLDLARGQGLKVPVIYNSSGYEEIDTLKMLEGYVDIYLPDLKYVDRELGRKYSHAEDYFEVAARAIGEMVRQVGKPVFTDEPTCREVLGAAEYQEQSEERTLIMTKGVIVRHLVLPGCSKDSMRVIDYLLKTYGNAIFLSIMNQYTPFGDLEKYPELSKKVQQKDYDKVVEFAMEHGIENGFIQEGDAAKESFIPEFKEKDYL